jgi:hypothetical protein
MKKFYSIMLLLFLCFFINACTYGSSEKPIQLSKIMTLYKRNKFIANVAYRYRTVYITGEIGNMDPFDYLSDDKINRSKHIVSIRDAYNRSIIGNAYCSFNKDQIDRILLHKSGDIVLLKGRIIGGTFVIYMYDCEVVEKDSDEK